MIKHLKQVLAWYVSRTVGLRSLDESGFGNRKTLSGPLGVVQFAVDGYGSQLFCLVSRGKLVSRKTCGVDMKIETWSASFHWLVQSDSALGTLEKKDVPPTSDRIARLDRA